LSTEHLPCEQHRPSCRFNDIQRILKQHGAHAPDFRGESHMFKATAVGILTNLSHTIELMVQHEEQWRKRLEREAEKRRRLEETQRAMAQEMAHLRHLIANRTLFNLVGPDFEEGPNSVIRDEEFYDAIDAESDRIEPQAMPTTHPLHAELEQAVTERIRNFANTDAFQPPGQQLQPLQHQLSGLVDAFGQSDDGTQTIGDWQVITQDGDMVIYKREVETEDGVVLDPLQAVHTVPGVTAREICTYFWDVQYRMDWEFTVDRPPTVLEVCGDDTVVLHQVYKRVWPTTQRDSLFWSHLRQVSVPFQPSSEGNSSVTSDRVTVLDSWMVVNMSTDYLSEKIAESSTPMIRLGLDVVLFCQTVIDSSLAITHNISIDSLPRDRLRTRLVYVANINPGGWVPAAGLRTLARREYPRFLKRFSAYVQEQTREKTALF
ncbi:goodpasture-antigen-binding protein kinase, partial [Clonorchis sinensis]